MSWTTIVILICVVLVAFGAYREYQRELRSNLAWRILATALAVLALGCIILPISYSSSTRGARKILLTEGFVKDSLINIKGDSIYTLTKMLKKNIRRQIY